jgi:hypothetical protein
MLYPKIAGMPLYVQGLPTRPEDNTYETRNARELYYLNAKGESTPDQDEMLKGYIMYYLRAPGWQGIREAFKDRNWQWDKMEELTIEELCDIMMDMGLDPF